MLVDLNIDRIARSLGAAPHVGLAKADAIERLRIVGFAVREVLWIFAASQLLAVIAVILGVIVKWAIILAAVVFAILGLAYLFLDRR